jgi:D-3-phosphoglycerate dehydrogenase
VAARALAFGMRVLAFDPHVAVEAVEEAGASFSPMDALLRQSDFVSLHARAATDNQGLMGRAQFAAMKPGAYFINTARETLVDEPALRDALESGRLAGAALDVVRPGPGDGRHPLLDAPNLILTPHIGGSTHETLARGAEMLAAEIDRFAKGQPLHHAMNAASAELARLDRPS